MIYIIKYEIKKLLIKNLQIINKIKLKIIIKIKNFNNYNI